MKKQETSESEAGLGRGFYEISATLFWALLIALVFRTFLFQPFYIPSASMMPNLLVGDYVFVSKYSYGYSRFSFPLGLPLFSGRHASLSEPRRGDIAVFRAPRNTQTDFIKRIVGLPGDRIQLLNSQLYINDVPVDLERVEDLRVRLPFGRIASIPRYRETMNNGVSYETLKELPRSRADFTGVYQVPEGHYFMMGDNRDNSTDSRFTDIIGYVPAENLIGRAEVVFFSMHPGWMPWRIWELPLAIRWNRIWNSLDGGE